MLVAYQCEPPPLVADARIHQLNTSWGGVTTYQCMPGYAFDDGRLIRNISCSEDGEWQGGTALKCLSMSKYTLF